jgi:uncharacterized membrane protein YkvA (DUF1232 family)
MSSMIFRSRRDTDLRLEQVSKGVLPSHEEVAGETRLLLDRLLDKAKAVAPYIPFAEDAVAAFYAVLDAETPQATRAALLAPLVYFITPFDAVPDFLPVLGYGDDAAILAAVLALLAGAIKPQHRTKAQKFLARSVSKSQD